MAATTPKPESILADVATALAAITTTGYRNTVATVNRQFFNPQTLGAGTKLPALAVEGEEIAYEVTGVGSTPRQTGLLKFKIQGLLRTASSPATAIIGLAQDVREKLYEDRSRGGYADNTHVARVEFGDQGFAANLNNVTKPFIGFLMEVEVQFQENL